MLIITLGVCCAQELARLHEATSSSSSSSSSSYDIILISSSNVLKESVGVMKITKHLEEVSVFERKADFFKLDNPSIICKEGVTVNSIDTINKLIYLNNNDIIQYYKVCICTGATPKIIINNPNVIGIRDIQTVEDLMNRVITARKVIVIGNGGIALEVIHALDFVDVDWYIKDDYVGNTFFDATASSFIMPSLLARSNHDNTNNPNNPNSTKSTNSTNSTNNTNNTDNTNNTENTNEYATINSNNTSSNNNTSRPPCGAALGPEWLSKNHHLLQRVTRRNSTLSIHFQQEIIAIKQKGHKWQYINNDNDDDDDDDNDDDYDYDEWPLYIKSSNNEILGCDFVISATGVVPSPVAGDNLDVDSDGAIIGNANTTTTTTSNTNTTS